MSVVVKIRYGVAVLACLVLIAGCGDEGPQRFAVSGTVTYQGKPVPRGEITFEPAGAGRAKGVGSVASIRDGKYETPEGLGTQGGSYRVRIVHLPLENEAAGTVEPLLFEPYETTVDLPAGDSQQDFEIPAAG